MNVMVIGSGGREHALAWKLARSPRVEKVFAAPGNAGTARVGENVPIGVSDGAGLVGFARANDVGMTVIGPDDALANGVADAFRAAGLRVVGPGAAAARLESSKSFAKDFMRRHGIPTAGAREFSDSAEARKYCREANGPLVVKADGLALGKGVTVAADPAEAEEAVGRAMERREFGEAGAKVLIEECLTGVECSIHALVDASGWMLWPDCRDHKRARDGDRGPNTGGMGTLSPSHSVDEKLLRDIRGEILDRFSAGVKTDGLEFQGMLFPGLMITAAGPKVLEFNCRFGDPETQVLVRRLNSDLLDLLEAVTEDRVATVEAEWDAREAVCVIMASGGYPGVYAKGCPISGIDEAESDPEVVVFHAGTAMEGDRLVTSGGRVLGVSALGETLDQARDRAYATVEKIHFENRMFRADIGTFRV